MRPIRKHKEVTLKKKFKNLDEKYMGFEPELKSNPTISDVETALRWYNHFHDFKDSLKFIGSYYKKNKVDQKNLKKINTTDLLEVGRVVGFLCRMKIKGVEVFPPEYSNIMVKKLQLIERIGQTRKDKEKVETKNVISVQQRITEKANSLMFDLEEAEDYFIDNKFVSDFSFKAFAQLNTIKRPIARKLSVMCQMKMNELENKEEDPDLKEAFSHLTKRQKGKIIKFWKLIIKGCDDIS